MYFRSAHLELLQIFFNAHRLLERLVQQRHVAQHRIGQFHIVCGLAEQRH